MNIIFDWAGTLANDQELTWRLTNETIRSFGNPSVTYETYCQEFRLPANEFYQRFCPGIAWEEIEAVFSDLCQRRYPHQVDLWAGVREGLACLVCKHKLFLLSTLNQGMLEETLQIQGLREYFQAVYGSVENKALALPAMLQELELSLDETVMVGDTPHDIAAGKAASIQALAVTYGYSTSERMLAVDPEMVFGSFQELMRYFDKLSFAESRHFPVATVGGLIFDDEGKALLVRTRKWSNLFGVPGGKVDYGESLQAAFIREVKEETGLDIDQVKFIMNQDCIEHPQFYRPRHYILVNYTARTTGSQPPVTLNYESNALVWASPREALAMDLNEPTRILIEKILETEES
jgi:phosphoglycolate phosphatase